MQENQSTNKKSVFVDLARTLSSPGHVVEISFAEPGTSKINTAIYHKDVTADNLASYSESNQNVFFLNCIDQTKTNFPLNKKTTRISKDAFVTKRNIISFDIDFKETYSDFDLLLPAEKQTKITEALFKHKSALTNLIGNIWLITISGNGMHLHLRANTPLECSNQEEYENGYKYIIKYLDAAVFHGELKCDTKCSNTGRLFRLPFSKNRKNASNPCDVAVLQHNEDTDNSDFIKTMFALSKKERVEANMKNENRSKMYDNSKHKDSLRAALTFCDILKSISYDKFSSFKNMSKGETICSSPWSTDKSPSCFLNEDKKIFNDFSTGKNGDVFDFLAEAYSLDIKNDFRKIIRKAEEITGIEQPKSHKKNASSKDSNKSMGEDDTSYKPKASYNDYIPFFKTHLGETRKDIFSRQLMCIHENTWQPVHSRLGVLSSFALDSSGFYKKNALEDHLARYTESHEPKLLVDIPQWDGKDRLHEISKAVILKNCTQDHFEELIKEWGSNMFRRVKNPNIQNPIIVLKGQQGVGKDHLIEVLVGGLGRLSTNFTITRNETDNLSMLADHMVLKISEFDRAAKVDAATLKDWIYRTEATFRRPYEKSHRRYDLRCSFIASVNVDEILRDHTGNRRFMIFDIESIEWNYPQEKDQILAQFQALAKSEYKASSAAFSSMKTYIETQTPDDPTQLILEDYDNRVQAFIDHDPERAKTFRFEKVRELLGDLARTHSIRVQNLQNLLKTNGRSRRNKTGVLYFLKEK